MLYKSYYKTYLSLFQQETGGKQRQVRETHAQAMISFLEMFWLLWRRSLQAAQQVEREKTKNKTSVCTLSQLLYNTEQHSVPALVEISDSLHGSVANLNFTINSSESETLAYETLNLSQC
ncbi:hypothetical protein XENOCAPTIV_005853 [Xenoophorus captivus]|uniref:Uncharacterized protein n=1 Tax=Xenoophorus captivus TaxID=1517983 RepID=A0ABV0S1I6_9TELE